MSTPRPLGGRPTRPTSRSAFTLVELMVVVTILTIGLSLTANTLTSTGRLVPMNRETARALESATAMSEMLRSTTFTEIYARFNDDPDDDPDGAGTAPGASFAAEGLKARPDDADGFVGRIVFPEQDGELREDVDDEDLGLPRDLNLDGSVDALDHSADYEILPYRVRIEWRGRTGDRSIEIHSAVVRP